MHGNEDVKTLKFIITSYISLSEVNISISSYRNSSFVYSNFSWLL